MTINPFNLIILVGAVHGLVLSALLLTSQRNRRSGNVLLALVLVFYTLPVLRVVLLDLGFFSAYNLWFLSIELLYGLGPSLYLYCKTVADPTYNINKFDLVHFSPVAFEIGYYFSPLFDEPTAYSFGAAEGTYHLIWMIQQLGAIFSVLIYLGLSNQLLWQHRNWVDENFSLLTKKSLGWLSNPIILYTMFFMFWFSLRLVDVISFGDRLSIEAYYPPLIFLSLSTYWIGTKGYLEDEIDVSGFNRDQTSAADDAGWDSSVIDAVFESLEASMRQDKVFLETDLSLPKLADILDINPRLLSKTINTKTQHNFYEYINHYRVREFKSLLETAKRNQTLIALAHESGFGSKATFNSTFKKLTGSTPSQYRNNIASKSNT